MDLLLKEVDKSEIKEMKATVEDQAAILKPPGDKDDALLKLLILGQHNHFPLLTYLVDTFHRYRLLVYQDLYDQLDKKVSSKQKAKFIGKKFDKGHDLATFLNNVMPYKKYIEKKGQVVMLEKHYYGMILV